MNVYLMYFCLGPSKWQSGSKRFSPKPCSLLKERGLHLLFAELLQAPGVNTSPLATQSGHMGCGN